MSSPTAYQPAENLTNRTFVGLISAQFLAGFNDQAIHASAMFYAIRTDTLSEASAITLMPILFFAPWAIFCTLAGYFADRYSKTMTLRIWKFSEILISLIMIGGFYLGSYTDHHVAGGWVVLSCVFLIGTHAAFFGPAKYGAMPEILRPHILSRGNGILESTTFLANIFGTVSGGLLMYQFHKNELWIGVILLVLSVIGFAASLLIAWLPPGNPDRTFPYTNPFKPLIENLGKIFRSRPLALSVLGIAFFVFMVAYMRASVYMHGETRNPRWNELKTSIIVAFVALGVGLGSPLAGYFSGGKIELGLVPIGCLGMTLGTLIAAIAIEHDAVLVVALIVIGFFSGFYMVPLYTLLQHRAPKASKGDLVATSNFINVTGAILASLLFNVLVQMSRIGELTPEVPVTDEVVVGTLEKIDLDEHGAIKRVVIKLDIGDVEREIAEVIGEELEENRVIDTANSFLDSLSGAPREGDAVIVSSYEIRNRTHFQIRKADQPLRKVFDNQVLPRYLFFGAALMTLIILLLLWRKLPDFFVRSLYWSRTLFAFRTKAVNMHNLPTEGPVILVSNCKDLHTSLQLVSATDRTTKVVLIEDSGMLDDGVLLRTMAEHFNLIVVRSDADFDVARKEALRMLRGGHLLAISMLHVEKADLIASLVHDLQTETGAPILPVFCGALDDTSLGIAPRVRIVFGETLTTSIIDSTATQAGAPIQTAMQTSAVNVQMIAGCKIAIEQLGEWIRHNDDGAGSDGR